MGNCLSEPQINYAVGSDAKDVREHSHRDHAQSAAALVTGQAAYSSMVELRIACNNLKKSDVLSKSDPMAVLYERQANGTEKEVGRTEVIMNEHDPVFVTAFKVVYNFERLQPYRLMVVDIDGGQKPDKVNPAACDFLGEVTFNLSEAVAAPDHKLTVPLDSRCNHKSVAHITCEELSSARDEITMSFVGVKLKNVELMSKSDPYLEICKSNQGDSSFQGWQPVYKTEVIYNNLNPAWKPVTVKATQLNNGDAYRPLLLKVWDYESSGSPRLIGQVETSGNQLEAAAKSGTPLKLDVPAGKKKKADVGSIEVRSYQVSKRPTFLDYIQAGTEISFTVAVDFTASNRNPTDPQSLHYLNPNGALTPYEQALMGVGRVLEVYDSDRQYPAFGFGGQNGNQPVSHCFPLNGRADGVCAGIAGIQQAYRAALSTWRLSGPTLFAPVVQAANAIAAQTTPHLRYNVLLILTDGAIMDMKETVEAIVQASSLPMSVLIVGIGDADFANMHELDGDEKRLTSSSGRIAERDIVQFVEFRNFHNNADELVQELLAELPGQFLEYVRTRNIPLPGSQ